MTAEQVVSLQLYLDERFAAADRLAQERHEHVQQAIEQVRLEAADDHREVRKEIRGIDDRLRTIEGAARVAEELERTSKTREDRMLRRVAVLLSAFTALMGLVTFIIVHVL